MKRLFILIVLIISFFYSVLNVYAENAVINDISIKETGGSIYTEEPSVNEDLVQAKTVFKELNDSVTYQISLKFDYALYKIDSVTDSNQNENITTNYSYQNDKLFMTLMYHDEINSSLNLEDINVQVTLTDAYENPGTGNDYTLLYFCFMIFGILVFCIIYQKKKFVILSILFLPIIVYAKNDRMLEFTFSGDKIGVGYDVTIYKGSDVTGEVEPVVCTFGSNCEMPSELFVKEGKFIAGWSTTDGGEIVYEAEGISLDFASLSSSNITLYPVWSDRVVSFEYTGSSSTYTVLRNGTYKLEVWGAQGGNASDATYEGGSGGPGGYSSGEIALSSNTTLYVIVGGQGESYNPNLGIKHGGAGGFGGAGAGGQPWMAGNSSGGAGGGGLSGIFYSSTYDGNEIIIAGGGGGAGGSAYTSGTNHSSGSNGGAGGGISGMNGVYNYCKNNVRSHKESSYVGIGGTQNAGGTSVTGGVGQYSKMGGKLYGGGGSGFSAGASGNPDTLIGGVAGTVSNTGASAGGSGGGGGGYYGGSGGGMYGMGGGGGSGYLSSSLTNPSTLDGTKSFASPSGEDETGHSGNGYARITYIG